MYMHLHRSEQQLYTQWKAVEVVVKHYDRLLINSYTEASQDCFQHNFVT